MTAPLSASPDLIAPAPTAVSAAELAKRGQIDKTAKDFETQFLGIMFQEMFKDVSVSEPFGGGQAEDMWKSFMTDAMARQTTKAGGIGLAASVSREMLKLQGLSA
ncbi:MAG TPA: rod-binding protein [Caulobacteraceae bacterium]|nr:rod-binding protein [Caulobacteraceae bacterium]